MDRGTYDPVIEPSTILERSLRESADLIARWHGVDDGRIGYAVTPRFAVSCTAEMLRESASLARATGTWWQTHVSEDPRRDRGGPPALPRGTRLRRRLRPRRRARGADRPGPRDPPLGPRAGAAGRDRDARRALSRLEPVHRRRGHAARAAIWRPGSSVGLGSDVSGGPEASIFSVMRVGAYAQMARRVAGRRARPTSSIRSTGCGWGRLTGRASSASTRASAHSRRARRRTSSPSIRRSSPRSRASPADDDPRDLMSRLIFRAHPDMVRGAWVRGRASRGQAGGPR